jgi:serpin B
VDERGSETAAETAVVMDTIISGAKRRAPEPPPFAFRADKPFLFVLRDHWTKMIPFTGRYTGPASAD